MSGSSVVLVGQTMAAVVEAVNTVEGMTGERPIVIGGLAVLSRLSSAHRATTDLDVVDRRTSGRDGQLEVLRRRSETTLAEPVGVIVPTAFGDVRVDVLEVNPADLEYPSDDSGDRLHAASHAWAADTASDMSISVVTSMSREIVSVSARVAEPGALIAMKLQSIMNRGGEKAGTDLWDIVRLALDPSCGQLALEKLRACDRQMLADIEEHVSGLFLGRRGWTLDRLHMVARGSVTADDVDLVGQLLLTACSYDGRS